MAKTLDSDQLGKKGQQHFGELCVSAGLIPNEATWDRKGWDYVLDWRHDPGEDAFDARPTLPSCLVQVKTVWDGANAVKAPLLALEHLAKDLKPAFLYVIPVVADEEFSTDAFIAHLDGKLLELILKSLRQARADKRTRLSKMELRLPLAMWFEGIPKTGSALRRALEDAIGPSMGAYADSKQQKLRDLGFESGRMELKLDLEAASHEEFVDGFLGIQPLKYVGAAATETRFGISLPVPDLLPPDGEIYVQPRPFDRCKLIIRDGPIDEPMTFNGDMYGPPSSLLAPDELHTMIRTALFDLRFSATGIKPPAKVTMKLLMRMSDEKIRKARLTAAGWSSFYKFLSAASDHPVSVEMIVGKGKKGPLSGMLNIDLKEAQHAGWAFAASVCQDAEEVLRRAGWPGTKLRIEDIDNAREGLATVKGLLHDPLSLTPLSFVGPQREGLRDEDFYEMLYVDGFGLGSDSIAYAVKAEMVAAVCDGGVEWRSTSLRLVKLARVKTRRRDLSQFLETAKREFPLQGLLVNGGFIADEA